jgi:hypothetical protein
VVPNIVSELTQLLGLVTLSKTLIEDKSSTDRQSNQLTFHAVH